MSRDQVSEPGPTVSTDRFPEHAEARMTLSPSTLGRAAVRILEETPGLVTGQLLDRLNVRARDLEGVYDVGCRHGFGQDVDGTWWTVDQHPQIRSWLETGTGRTPRHEQFLDNLGASNRTRGAAVDRIAS